MKKNEFAKKSLPLLKWMLSIEKTVFYIEMKNMIYSFESTVDNMKMELENPDLISTIEINLT